MILIVSIISSIHTDKLANKSTIQEIQIYKSKRDVFTTSFTEAVEP